MLEQAGQRCDPSQPARHDGGGVATLRSAWSWAVLGGWWRRFSATGRVSVASKAGGVGDTCMRPGSWGTLLTGQVDDRV
jgi:hypothetical protein